MKKNKKNKKFCCPACGGGWMVRKGQRLVCPGCNYSERYDKKR